MSAGDADGAIAAPNIWDAPHVYEIGNRGMDRAGVLDAAIGALGGWAGRDVLDVGCGSGFHLPRLASSARSVVGVEPHAPLATLARARVAALGLTDVRVRVATAQRTGLADRSVDVAQARWAYFFGPGCEPGLAELARVVRPGGTAYVIDVDATRSTYGEWFRGAWASYDPVAVERFWTRQGWLRERLTVTWELGTPQDFAQVLRLEVAPLYAERLLAAEPGRTGVDYAVNLRWRRF